MPTVRCRAKTFCCESSDNYTALMPHLKLKCRSRSPDCERQISSLKRTFLWRYWNSCRCESRRSILEASSFRVLCFIQKWTKDLGERDLHIAHARRSFICTIHTQAECVCERGTSRGMQQSYQLIPLPETSFNLEPLYAIRAAAAETICANCAPLAKSDLFAIDVKSTAVTRDEHYGVAAGCCVLVHLVRQQKVLPTVSTRDGWVCGRARWVNQICV